MPTYVTQPFLPPLEEVHEYLEQIWASKRIANNGPYHQELEAALRDYLGVPHVSLFANGTLALVVALQAMRITGEVITTPYSFVATAHALSWNGITPVFADVLPDTYTLDPQQVEAHISPKTTAILPVQVYGNPCRHDNLQQIADTYGLKVIYDAAHTFGARLHGISLANYGDASILSFHATKVYHTFEGGAIICHDAKLKERIDYYKNFGFANETTVIGTGINAKMNEFQAAMGLLNLKYIEQQIEGRKARAAHYSQQLQTVPGIDLLPAIEGLWRNYSYFPVFIDAQKLGKSRDEVYHALRRHDIYSRRYFYPLISDFPAYRGLASAQADNLPHARQLAQTVLCLPMYADLPLETIDDIVTMIKQ